MITLRKYLERLAHRKKEKMNQTKEALDRYEERRKEKQRKQFKKNYSGLSYGKKVELDLSELVREAKKLRRRSK